MQAVDVLNRAALVSSDTPNRPDASHVQTLNNATKSLTETGERVCGIERVLPDQTERSKITPCSVRDRPKRRRGVGAVEERVRLCTETDPVSEASAGAADRSC